MSASVQSKAEGAARENASKVLTNFLALGSGEAVARIIAFAGLLYIARTIGVGGYGVISFVAGVTLYLTKIADFGIETIGSAEVARRPKDISRFASAILSARLLVTAP